MHALLGILIAVSALEEDRGLLENLIPPPKFVYVGSETIGAFNLTGAEGFHRAVLPPASFLQEGAECTIRVRLWDDLGEEERSGVPPEFSQTIDNPEAYAIHLKSTGGVVTAGSRQGLQHGLATLRQACILAEDTGSGLPEMTVMDWPDTAIRGAHVCYHLVRDWMPYSAPDYETLVRSLERFAQLKYNTVLLEFEAMFPFQHHPDISAGCAFTVEQIREIVRLCEDLQLDLVPLLQCLGHQYYLLIHERYRDVRETPDKIQQLCPTNPRSAELVLELIDEYRELMPNLKTFHLGGDESRQLGDCIRCKAKIDQEGISALYVDHVAKVCQGAIERGLVPTVWSDMLEHHPQCLERIPEETVIAYWNYDFKKWPREYAAPLFQKAGYQVVAYPGIRFGQNVSHVSVNYPVCMPGIRDLTRAALDDGVTGVITTNWMKGIPYELCWRGYCYAAWEPWSAGRERAEFDRAFTALWYGLDRDAGEALVRAYDNLAVWVPYAEDSGSRSLDFLDRLDLRGLPVGARIDKYTAPSEREKTIRQLSEAKTKIDAAQSELASAGPKVRRNAYEWQLLDLGARTLDHKIRMGLLFDRAAAWIRGEVRLDDGGRSDLRGKIDRLKNEWAVLREETRSLLAETNPPTCAASLAEVKFEQEAFTWLQNYQRLLMQAEKEEHPERFAPENAPP